MDRYTYKDAKGEAWYGGGTPADHLHRLTEYEETGYTPQEFERLCREMSAIRTALAIDTYEHLREIVEQDRLLVLPYAPRPNGLSNHKNKLQALQI